MNKHQIWILLVTISVNAYMSLPELSMVIIIPSYNNSTWVYRNLKSVAQRYRNYRVIYIDDCSTDGMGACVDKFLAEHPIRVPFQVVHNPVRRGAMANIYWAISQCESWEIVILLDGDDELYDPYVLEKVNRVYWERGVLFTHGLFVELPGGATSWSKPIPMDIILSNNIRAFAPHPSHLRTFYAELFHRIHIEDLQYEGDFLPMTGDVATVLPIVEMAGERIYFFNEPMYTYNMINPINDNKVNAALQRYLEKVIRSRPPYKRLSDSDAKIIMDAARNHARNMHFYSNVER